MLISSSVEIKNAKISKKSSIKTTTKIVVCASNEDCNFLGTCSSNVCTCQSGWIGANCNKLDFVKTLAYNFNTADNVSKVNTIQLGGGTSGEYKAVGDSGNKTWGGSILKHPFTGVYYWIGSTLDNSCSINNFARSSRCAVWKSVAGADGPYNLLRYISTTVSGVPGSSNRDWCHSAKAVFEKKAASPTDRTVVGVALVMYAMTIPNPGGSGISGLNDCRPTAATYFPRYSNDAALTAGQKVENDLSAQDFGNNDKQMTVFYQDLGSASPSSAVYTAAFETNMWNKVVLVDGDIPSFSSTDKIAGWNTGVPPLADTNTFSHWITNPSPITSAVDGSFPFTYISGGNYITPGYQKLVLVRSQNSSNSELLSVLAMTASKYIWETGARFYQGPQLQSNDGSGGAYTVMNDEDPFFYQNDLGYHIISHNQNDTYCKIGGHDSCGAAYRLPLSTSPYVDANRLVGNNGWAQMKDPSGNNIYGNLIPFNTSSTVSVILRQSPSIYFEGGYPILLNQPVTLSGTIGTSTRIAWCHNLIQPFVNNGNPSGPLTFPQYSG
jgi:hypothetical protein